MAVLCTTTAQLKEAAAAAAVSYKIDRRPSIPWAKIEDWTYPSLFATEPRRREEKSSRK